MELAIATEEAGLSFYKDCLSKVSNHFAQELFRFLITDEKRHKATLFALKKLNKDAKKKGATINNFLEFNITSPIFDKKSTEEFQLSEASLSDMINKAIAFEDKGANLYSELAEAQEDHETRRLLEKLSADEVIHKKIIVKLGFKILGIQYSV